MTARAPRPPMGIATDKTFENKKNMPNTCKPSKQEKLMLLNMR